MVEVEDCAVDLVVTSPPYWEIKDYGVTGQIGYGQSLHEYLRDLYYVWRESFRVLRPGGRLCLNIGDQFARAAVYGRYKVIPLHAEFIGQCEGLGFDFLGSIIWQKKTTMNTTGGATVMGSYPYPPNGLVELDYEFIQIFKKPGVGKKVSPTVKEASKLTKEEWKEYFSGHWYFGGARQVGHEAMFPEELPRRLISMFTFVGDTVLDPFLGSGTTVKAALAAGRNALGYEINEDFLDLVATRLGPKETLPGQVKNIQVIESRPQTISFHQTDYFPRIAEARPLPGSAGPRARPAKLYKVVGIVGPEALQLDTGQTVGFLGVKIDRLEEAVAYFQKFLVGKEVILRPQDQPPTPAAPLAAYVYLKNRIFVNGYLIKSGLGSPDGTPHKFQAKFARWHQERTP